MLLTYLDSHYKPDTRVLGIFVLKIGRNKLYNWQCGRDTWKTISWLTKQTRYSCSRNFDSTSEGFLKIERRKLFDWQFGKSTFLQDNILAQNANQIPWFPELWQNEQRIFENSKIDNLRKFTRRFFAQNINQIPLTVVPCSWILLPYNHCHIFLLWQIHLLSKKYHMARSKYKTDTVALWQFDKRRRLGIDNIQISSNWWLPMSKSVTTCKAYMWW